MSLKGRILYITCAEGYFMQLWRRSKSLDILYVQGTVPRAFTQQTFKESKDPDVSKTIATDHQYLVLLTSRRMSTVFWSSDPTILTNQPALSPRSRGILMKPRSTTRAFFFFFFLFWNLISFLFLTYRSSGWQHGNGADRAASSCNGAFCFLARSVDVAEG